MTNTDRVLARVLSDVVGYAGSVSGDLAPSAVPGWDSLAHISIIEELESRFNIRFSTEEMVAMTDVRAIKEALARHGVTEEA